MTLPAPRRFTSEQYAAMGQAGILGEDDRVELIAGEIIQMSPVGYRHILCVTLLTGCLNQLLLALGLGERWLVSPQNPIHLPNDTELMPDIAIIARRAYTDVPTAADTLLVIEVSDTTLHYDRNRKLHTYARAGIPEYWIVNLVDNRLERYTDPVGQRYRTTGYATLGQSLTATVLPLTVATQEIIPQ
jgi:Uma2 family endonuclease